MEKKVAYHFQGAPNRQTAKASVASAQIHSPSLLPRHKLNGYPNPQHPILGGVILKAITRVTIFKDG
ncbi:unnamed protein product [Hymenolepis diminuta]|uniref:Uncharacterized protein n=1 Tax=Hymenolepis diminuta TaxID=6216 RepID=A0A0R3SNX6_HYMDI|nr:unnamed protein product [Hymenolepis diminuta]